MTSGRRVGREEELQALRQRLAQRRSFLFHGPVGVGKTLLLRHVLPEFPDFLYCPESPNSHAMFRTLAAVLLRARSPRLVRAAGRGGVEALEARSAINIKGIVVDALHEGEYVIVLDQLQRPSQGFGAVIREVMGWGATPVVAVAHSPHMEDLGFFIAFYPDRADKLELKNFDSDLAETFAREAMQRAAISAHNSSEFLERVLEVSRGNPGAILSMIEMARHPKYLSGDHIKIAPLYIDFRMNWKPAGAR